MYDKLVNYAAKQLELDASEIKPDSTFESLGIDSLDIVEMIMDLESELGVELDMEDQKITTFQELADFIGSTAAMIGRARVSPAKEFIVVTEPGILHPLRREMPDKIFYPAPSRGEGTKGIGECNFMKKITLEKIAASLEEMKYEVVLDEELRRRAERSIQRMLEVSK